MRYAAAEHCAVSWDSGPKSPAEAPPDLLRTSRRGRERTEGGAVNVRPAVPDPMTGPPTGQTSPVPFGGSAAVARRILAATVSGGAGREWHIHEG